MSGVKFCGFAATIACATFAASSAEAAAPIGKASPLRTASRPTTAVGLRVEYTDFSKLYGDRVVATAESHFGVAKETQVSVSVSSGRRRANNEKLDATQLSGAIDHKWTDRLSTHTAVSLANNGSIFAKRQLVQDASIRLTGGLVATLGGKYSDYGRGNRVTTWSAGAAYYLRGAALSYRFSLLDSNRLGRSSAHLASFRVNDPGGSGSTQLWFGRGSSLYDVNASPEAAKGTFTSIALRRQQPLAPGLGLNFGVNRTWYSTPAGSYRGTGVTVGLSAAGFKL